MFRTDNPDDFRDLVKLIECEVRRFNCGCTNSASAPLSCADVINCMTPTINDINKRIDNLIINGIPIHTLDTVTLDLSGDGTLANPLFGDVNVSSLPFNGIMIVEDGLYDPVPIQNQRVYGGVVTWTGVDHTYNISAAGYYINFVFYQSPATTVTLQAADPTFNRLDTFIVNTASTATVLTGTPSSDPSEPPLDPATQLRLSAVLVEQNSVIPTVDQCIYLENTEWTTLSSNPGRINPNSGTTPCSDLIDIEGTNVLNGDNILFTNPTGNFTPKSYNFLEFNIRSKGAWNNSQLSLQWELGGVPVGNPVIIANTTYGFDELNTSTCQTIVVPLNDFIGLTFASQADSFRIIAVVSSTFIGFILDNICLSTADLIPQNSTSLIYNNFLTRTGNTVQFGGTLLHNTQAYTGPFIQTFSGATVHNYPYQFFQDQNFANGTSVTSFQNSGGISGQPDYFNKVRLGINYTGAAYPDTPSNHTGYFGTEIGYWLGVNAFGGGPFIRTEDTNSKLSGIFFNTLDTGDNTNAFNIFTRPTPNATGIITLTGSERLSDYKIFSGYTTGQLKANKYGIGTFAAAETFLAGFDASGNIVEVNPAGIGGNQRFAVSGEDDTAAQFRTFDNTNYQFNINSTQISGDYMWGFALSGPGLTTEGGLFAGVTVEVVNEQTEPIFAQTSATSILAYSASNNPIQIGVGGLGLSSYSGGFFTKFGIGGFFEGTDQGVIGMRSDFNRTDEGFILTNISGKYPGLFVYGTAVSTNNNINSAIALHAWSNTPTTNFGTSIDFFLTDVSGGVDISNRIISKWTDATAVSRTSQAEIWGVNNAITHPLITVNGSGLTTITTNISLSANVDALNAIASGNGIAVHGHGGSVGVWAQGTSYGVDADTATGVSILANSSRVAEDGLPHISIQDSAITPAINNILDIRYSTKITGGGGIGYLGHTGYRTKNINSGSLQSEYFITVSNATDLSFGDEILQLASGGRISYPQGLQNFANDAAAAVGGIAINQQYRNGSQVMIRVT